MSVPEDLPRPKAQPHKQQQRLSAAGLPPTAALAVVIAASLGGLAPLFRDPGWWFSAFSISLLVLIAIAAARALLPWAALASLIGTVLLVVLLTVSFASSVALVGVIPTAAVVDRFVLLGTTAVTEIATGAVPMNVTLAMSFLLAAGGGVLAIVADAIAIGWRRPALVGIPCAVLVAIPGAFPGIGFAWLLVALAAAAFALLLYVAAREVRPGGALAVGAASVAIALLLPFALPAVEAENRTRFGAGSTVVNPDSLIDLSKNLQLTDPVTVLTYRTLTDEGKYLRLGTISQFEGDQWVIDSTVAHAGTTITHIPRAPGLSTTVVTVPRATSIRITALAGTRLPAPYAPVAFQGLGTGWKWDSSDLTVSSDTEVLKDASYVVQTELAEPTVAQLRSTTKIDPAEFADYLALPPDLPPTVVATARDETAKATTQFDRALALQSYFTSGAFEYSEQAPVTQGFDGASGAIVGTFLTVKKGYCVHFASAMATMARSLGIPARMAIGFTAGTHVDPGGQGDPYFVVTSRNLHAWPELYFSGIGWVRFEPTPGRGSVPDFSAVTIAEPSATPTPDPSSSASTSTSTPRPRPTASTPTAQASVNPTFAPNSQSGSLSLVPAITVTALGIAAVLALLLPLLPAARRTVRRLLRYRRIARTGDAEAAWLEVRDTVIDTVIDVGLGASSVSTSTPAELAALIGPLLGDRAALDRLLAAIETQAYSRHDSRSALADVREVRRAILATVSVRERLRAVVSPASNGAQQTR